MYKIIYDEEKPTSIQKDNMYIPICDGNRDYQEFLEWNAKQKTKLDITKSIVVTKSAEAIYEEQVQAKEREILRRQAIAELGVK